MADYPNREHKNADEAARRRALAALDHMANEVAILWHRIELGNADGDDARQIANLARDITQHVAILGALREVREWHALDQAGQAKAPCPDCGGVGSAHANACDPD